MQNRLTFIAPDDWHLHIRDDALMRDVLPHTIRQFKRAIIMPNLKTPVTTVALAAAYRTRILEVLSESGAEFTPLMTLYLTDQTSADEIRRARTCGFIHAVKLYPAGATTHSAAGVTDLRHCAAALETMQELEMPLLIHGEVTDPDVDIFDREAVFIERVLIPLRQKYPALKIVLEHITTRHAVQYVQSEPATLAATITAHHLLFNRNALFKGGIRPHYFCLPILKREPHRQALLAAATSGNPKFFLGTDSAPHLQTAKEQACGCAGCYTALHALELYASAFETVDRLAQLEGFASLHGPAFYNLPVNCGTITLFKQRWKVPEQLAFASATIIPLLAGEELEWQVEPVLSALDSTAHVDRLIQK